MQFTIKLITRKFQRIFLGHGSDCVYKKKRTSNRNTNLFKKKQAIKSILNEEKGKKFFQWHLNCPLLFTRRPALEILSIYTVTNIQKQIRQHCFAHCLSMYKRLLSFFYITYIFWMCSAVCARMFLVSVKFLENRRFLGVNFSKKNVTNCCCLQE